MNKRAGIKRLRSRASGAIRRLRRFVPRGPQPAILMYHRIGTETFDPWGLAVAPERFEAQLQWLARARTILPLTEFAAMHRQANLPGKAVALTFDDGWRDNAANAFPLLQKHQVPASIFLSTDFIGSRQRFWWESLGDRTPGSLAIAVALGGRGTLLGPVLGAMADRLGLTFVTVAQLVAHRLQTEQLVHRVAEGAKLAFADREPARRLARHISASARMRPAALLPSRHRRSRQNAPQSHRGSSRTGPD